MTQEVYSQVKELCPQKNLYLSAHNSIIIKAKKNKSNINVHLLVNEYIKCGISI